MSIIYQILCSGVLGKQRESPPFPLQPPAAQPQLTYPVSRHSSEQLAQHQGQVFCISVSAGIFVFLYQLVERPLQDGNGCTEHAGEREVRVSFPRYFIFASLKSNTEAEEEEKESLLEANHTFLILQTCRSHSPHSYVYVHTCLCAQVHVSRVQCQVSPLIASLPNFLREGFSMALEVNDWPSQAGQQAPTFFLTQFHQFWDNRYLSSCLEFPMDNEDPNSSPYACVASTLLDELHPCPFDIMTQNYHAQCAVHTDTQTQTRTQTHTHGMCFK